LAHEQEMYYQTTLVTFCQKKFLVTLLPSHYGIFGWINGKCKNSDILYNAVKVSYFSTL